MNQLSSTKNYDFISFGNALVDLLGHIPHDFLLENDLVKGAMILCDQEEQEKVISNLKDYKVTAGGSAANTATTLSLLGLDCGYIGSIANDHWGEFFSASMNEIEIDPFLQVHDNRISSGTSLCLITPDAERTMYTHLGSANLISKDHLPLDELSRTKFFFIEGYAFDGPSQKEAVYKAIETIKTSGGKFAATLSDSFCVQRHKDDLVELLKYVDILFSNEDEFKEMFDIDDVTNFKLENLPISLPNICAITRSENDVIVFENGHRYSVPAESNVDVLDLTGAGDQFAAGFMYGHIRGYEISDCAALGVKLASKVISKIGPRIDKSELNEIKEINV